MPAPAVPSELEVKLLVPRARDVRAIARLTQLGSYHLEARDTVRLHSVYLDTAALTLARHGVAMRLRRLGEHWEATAKWGGEVTGDVHVRPELTVALEGTPTARFALPAGPLHTRLAALVAGRPLRPLV